MKREKAAVPPWWWIADDQRLVKMLAQPSLDR